MLPYFDTISDLSHVTTEHYDNALGCVGKKVSILYKRKPCCEVNIGPHGSRCSKIDQVKFIKGCLQQISLRPFFNTLSHTILLF